MFKSLFAALFLGVSCNIPIFTNDASLNTKNFVSFFDCSQQILYSESQIPLDNLYFVPWSALSLDNYIIQCPENPVYSELPRDLEKPFLLLAINGSISNFNGQVIVALKENHQPLVIYKIVISRLYKKDKESQGETHSPIALSFRNTSFLIRLRF